MAAARTDTRKSMWALIAALWAIALGALATDHTEAAFFAVGSATLASFAQLVLLDPRTWRWVAVIVALLGFTFALNDTLFGEVALWLTQGLLGLYVVGSLAGPRICLWRLRRTTGFSDRLTKQLTVPPGPAGRPGERVLSYSESMWPCRVDDDGIRGDFRVFVGRGGSAVSAVCLGRVEDEGTPRESAMKALEKARKRNPGFTPELVADVVAGEPAVRFHLPGKACTATDWRFARSGWIYSAGVLCFREDDEAEMHRRAHAILASWRWVEPAEHTPAPDG